MKVMNFADAIKVKIFNLFSTLLLCLCVVSVSPGGFYCSISFTVLFAFLYFHTYHFITANDLHFHDGASTADVIAGDVFFEILDPPELRYTYRIRPAKDFGVSFVSFITNIIFLVKIKFIA